jgi:hypothetical protein
MATAAKKLEIKTPALSALAAESLAKHGPDWRVAAKALLHRLENDTALYRALARPLLEQAVWDAIRAAARHERGFAWKGPRPVDPAGDGGLNAVASTHLSELMGFPLPGGVPLGEARRPEIAATAKAWATSAKTTAFRATWLRLVASALPDDKQQVKTVLTEAKLKALQAKAKR